MRRDWNEVRDSTISTHISFLNYLIRKIDESSMTPIEKITAAKLRFISELYGERNITVNPQKTIGKYRVDFEIVHHPYFLEKPLHKIIVECDGHDFHEKTKEQASKDKARDRFMAKKGYTLLRYSGRDIVTNPLQIIEDIIEVIDPKHHLDTWGEEDGS